MDSGGKHLWEGKSPSTSFRREICGSDSGVLSATALATVYQNEVWDEFGDNLHPTKIFVIGLFWIEFIT